MNKSKVTRNTTGDYAVKKKGETEKDKKIKVLLKTAREDYFKYHGHYPEEDNVVIKITL